MVGEIDTKQLQQQVDELDADLTQVRNKLHDLEQIIKLLTFRLEYGGKL